jgi:RimJ/RimL family protein N-acetyltransferase
MDSSTFHLETKNLLLVAITMEYKDEIFQEFTSEITTFMYPKPAKTIKETMQFIEDSIKLNKEGKNLQLVILAKDKRTFLGCLGVQNIDSSHPELGIWIKKSAHGNAYGKEAILAIKKWADNHLRYEYLIYPVSEENYASKRIPQLLGGEAAREYDEVNMSGKMQHMVEYRIYRNKKTSV